MKLFLTSSDSLFYQGRNLLSFSRRATTKKIGARSDFFCSSNSDIKSNLNVERKLLSLSKQFYEDDSSQPFSQVLLAGVQHLLSTTVDMFSVLKKLGLEKAVVTGKSYSNHSGSIEKFKKLGFDFVEEVEQSGYGQFGTSMHDATNEVWRTVMQILKQKERNGLLIALDDGADLLLTTPTKLFNGISYKPNSVIGIEQTRGGSNRLSFRGLNYPVINVAGSWIKNVVEYPKVAAAIAEKVSVLVKDKIDPMLNKKPTIGVIGNGSMGTAITQKLINEGYRVGIYEQNEKKQSQSSNIRKYPNINLLIANTDIIIGCTGQDITASEIALNAFLYARDSKWLISTGSKDIEFKTLLETIQGEMKKFNEIPNPLADINYKNHEEANILIARGGFPINFDNTAHSVPPEGIWPTRAALLLACRMGVKLYQTNHPMLKTAKTLMLDPKGQRLIFREYQAMNPHDENIRAYTHLTDDQLEEHISAHSEGEKALIDNSHTHSKRMTI